MTTFHKDFGSSIGPFGIPMRSNFARLVEATMKRQPRELRNLCRTNILIDGKSQTVDGYLRMGITPKDIDTADGPDGHTDISAITTDALDRQMEVVIADGLNFDQFKANPIVTFCHDYYSPPIGKCLWVKKSQFDGGMTGWKAQTRYSPRPATHPESAEWFPDTVWHFVQIGDMPGKSIGFIPMTYRNPTAKELEEHPDWEDASTLIDGGMVLEYCACPVPANGTALVESVAKAKSQGFPIGKMFEDALGLVLPDYRKRTVVQVNPTPTPKAKEMNKSELPDETMDCLKSMSDMHNARVGDDDGRKSTGMMLGKVFERALVRHAMHGPKEVMPDHAGLSRVRAMCRTLKNGKPRFGAYTQDNDLLPDEHPRKKAAGAAEGTNAGGGYATPTDDDPDPDHDGDDDRYAATDTDHDYKFLACPKCMKTVTVSQDRHDLGGYHGDVYDCAKCKTAYYRGSDGKAALMPPGNDVQGDGASGEPIGAKSAATDAAGIPDVNPIAYNNAKKAIKLGMTTKDEMDDPEEMTEAECLGKMADGTFVHPIMSGEKMSHKALDAAHDKAKEMGHVAVMGAAKDLKSMAAKQDGADSAMPEVNGPGVSHAKAAAKSGDITDVAWDAPNGGDRKADDCLGKRPGATPAAMWMYPVFTGGKLNRNAVKAAEGRATTEGHAAIAKEARAIMAMIQAHDEKIAKGFVTPEAIEAAAVKELLASAPDIAKEVAGTLADLALGMQGKL
jgi:hypothetical protein